MKVAALAGGTGSAKLLRGLKAIGAELTVVANVGDNAWIYGVYVCPDVDIACYTLAGIADRTKGWGIRGDTFHMLDLLGRAGTDTWFRLGDRDLATCLARTQLLREGLTLTGATEAIAEKLGTGSAVLPACDEPVQTVIRTPEGELNLQEFWVREKGRPRALGVEYRGSGKARPTARVKEAIGEADVVVVCPANPVTSVGPSLAIPGFIRLLKSARRVVALSPMVGNSPYSGPAGKLMEAVEVHPSSLGVAKMYSGFADAIVISDKDARMAREIREMGLGCVATGTMMEGGAGEARVAREVLSA
ncbi:MAG: 2-phospho-L-lactate transferase [Nitrososphaerota archaeon]|jgi:LPPG:FO 2-phospho-L-lactate transferase|nr:2-phospho-L-lactate transferase [Nitrososphaerota archaeon]